MTEYKGWTITNNPKPIPDRRYDYDVEHPDYEQMLSCVSVADLAMVLRECAYSLTIVGMVGLVYINIA